jgi:hypothetical protein
MAIEPDYTAQGGVWNKSHSCWEWRDGHGRLHRVAGPAEICPDGEQRWYLHGRFHRADGPACVFPNGGQGWYVQGQLHRVDGPAVIWPDGHQEWWLHGQRHRDAGPAVIYADGSSEWYVQARHITDEVLDWMQANDVTWPFTSEQQVEFCLRWL